MCYSDDIITAAIGRDLANEVIPMKKLMMVLLALVLVATGAAAWKWESVVGWLHTSRARVDATAAEKDVLGTTAKNGKKILITYFSWGGNTRAAARAIHEKIGGDIFEIRTETPYPAGYSDTVAQAKKEKAENIHPPLTASVPGIGDYDLILLGYPIWWFVEPMPIRSFLDAHNLDGKTILPFATSGGSSIHESVESLRASAPKADIRDGHLCNVTSSIDAWLGDVEAMAGRR